MPYFLTLALTLAACFGIQSFALLAVGGRTTKSESNFFSSIARVQNGLSNPSQVLLLGSSRTGRLPDRLSLPSQFPHVVNLGCDGASAAIMLRSIDRGLLLPLPHTVIIEGNTLIHDIEGRGHELEKYLESPWFRVGVSLRLLRSDARPSAIAYSQILKRKIGGFATSDGETPLPNSTSANVVFTGPSLSPDILREVLKLASIINRLRSRGVRVLLVILPPRSEMNSLNMVIPSALSHTTEVPLLDLTNNLPEGAVRYTDGIHMAPASAAAALRSILHALDNM